MDSSKTEDGEYDWSQLEQPAADTLQLYVFLIHVLLGIIISVLSFPSGWVSWGTGIGALTPFLLAVTGGFYLVSTGIDWYRDEFIPFLTRIHMIPEFETDRFIKYQRIQRVLVLISGYISLVICQYIWTQVANFLLGFTVDLGDLLEFLTLLYLGMLFVHAFVLIFFLAVLDYFLRSAFSDVKYIIVLEDKMQAYFREKRNAEAEAAKLAKEQAKEEKKKMKKKSKEAPSTPD